MKFKDFINEAPMMGDSRVKKNDGDAKKWLDAIRKEVIDRIESGVDENPYEDSELQYNFRYLETFESNGFTFDEFSKYEYGRVISVRKGDDLITVLKYDHYNKEYFAIEMIVRDADADSKVMYDAIITLAKYQKKKGMISDRTQTTGGRKMWKRLIEMADKNNWEYGYFERSKKTKWDGSLKEFQKFADDELYDSNENPNRAKFSYFLYFEF